MKYMQRAFWNWLGRKLRGHFLAGILIIVPIGITIWILVWLFTNVDNILQPIIKGIFGHPIPGVGFGVMIVLIYLAGVIASNVGGKRLIQYAESLLVKVPVVRPLYNTIKQIMNGFSTPSKTGFLQTVLVEFPRKDIWTIGFITNECLAKSGEPQLNIFIPTAPNPTGGFLQIVREGEVIRTDIPTNIALQMIISAGKVSPQEIIDKVPGKIE